MHENLTVDHLQKYTRAANYICAAQIYLQDNFLLERPLIFDDIKPRLLGHWGTSPGINFTYAYSNYLVKKFQRSTLFVLGPGHGYPALQANLFIEGTLEKYNPQATANLAGLAYVCKQFSWPYGFPSHSNPATPGVIVEGGELGYALSTAYGAVLDNPELLAMCLIGDGEAETGATATAWHLSKYVNPVTNGVVLPILHLNGYKISGPTLFGRMTNRELKQLFAGYGYTPFIVEGSHETVYEKMLLTIDTVYALIAQAQQKPFTGFKKLPMIILKTPKGWTGIKYLHGKKIEGNNLSHQIVVDNAKTDLTELRALEKWLRSYKFNELFNPTTGFSPDVKSVVPEPALRMGDNSHVYPARSYIPLVLADTREYQVQVTNPGATRANSMRSAGAYLRDVFSLNQAQQNIRLFSPDEIYSNKLDAVLQATPRAFVLPLKSWDIDLAPQGQVIEILSEHSLQGLAQGYILTGRHALYASYEAFIEIISSMADQYIKFLQQAHTIAWRRDYSSLTYILSSSGWRQEHNGFSHQNPGFVSDMLQKHGPFVKAYFPPDSNSIIAALAECLQNKNGINIITAGKTDELQWLTLEQAQENLATGIMIWPFASESNPDIVFAAVGDYMTTEALAALYLLKQHAPQVRTRFVNICMLSGPSDIRDKIYQKESFNAYFTSNKPVIINYHGYPDTIKALLYDQHATERFRVYGYLDEGSTTTPFDMHVRNHTDRYNLLITALELLAQHQVLASEQAQELIREYTKKLVEHKQYIQQWGKDPQEITRWQWTTSTT